MLFSYPTRFGAPLFLFPICFGFMFSLLFLRRWVDDTTLQSLRLFILSVELLLSLWHAVSLASISSDAVIGVIMCEIFKHPNRRSFFIYSGIQLTEEVCFCLVILLLALLLCLFLLAECSEYDLVSAYIIRWSATLSQFVIILLISHNLFSAWILWVWVIMLIILLLTRRSLLYIVAKEKWTLLNRFDYASNFDLCFLCLLGFTFDIELILYIDLIVRHWC
jgi:hypothetical protein